MSAPDVDDELSRLRVEVDRVDLQLVALLCERARLAGELGSLKRARGLALLDPVRESLILSRVAAAACPPLTAEAARRIWGAILTESRAIVIATAAGD